jgi:nicotinamide-nucleotide amidase
VQIEIVTIGDELLLGFTTDTNAAHIARALADLGVSVVRRATVGDDRTAIADAVADALSRADGVITTGGLGPTSDDMSKDAVASLFGRQMVLHEPTLTALHERWKQRGLGPLPETNRAQALVPEGAELLDNRHGTAPGIWIQADGKWVAMLPGVPREMRGMLADAVLPKLRALLPPEPVVVASRTVRTTGMAESAIADRVADVALPEGVQLAYLPSWEGVDLRVTIRGVPPEVAHERLTGAANSLASRVASVVYSMDGDDLAAIALDALRMRRMTFAAGESCTGGLLAARLTAIPGASDVVLGGVVAYENRVKTRLLGVSEETLAAHGAVSEAVAAAMASGVRAATGASFGVGITGVAGPSGGTAAKPVGTVCWALSWPGGSAHWTAQFVGDRGEVQRRSTQAALMSLVRALADVP